MSLEEMGLLTSGTGPVNKSAVSSAHPRSRERRNTTQKSKSPGKKRAQFIYIYIFFRDYKNSCYKTNHRRKGKSEQVSSCLQCISL